MKSNNVEIFFARLAIIIFSILVFVSIFKLFAMFCSVVIGLSMTTYGGIQAAIETDALLRGFVNFFGNVDTARNLALFGSLITFGMWGSFAIAIGYLIHSTLQHIRYMVWKSTHRRHRRTSREINKKIEC